MKKCTGRAICFLFLSLIFLVSCNSGDKSNKAPISEVLEASEVSEIPSSESISPLLAVSEEQGAGEVEFVNKMVYSTHNGGYHYYYEFTDTDEISVLYALLYQGDFSVTNVPPEYIYCSDSRKIPRFTIELFDGDSNQISQIGFDEINIAMDLQEKNWGKDWLNDGKDYDVESEKLKKKLQMELGEERIAGYDLLFSELDEMIINRPYYIQSIENWQGTNEDEFAYIDTLYFGKNHDTHKKIENQQEIEKIIGLIQSCFPALPLEEHFTSFSPEDLAGQDGEMTKPGENPDYSMVIGYDVINIYIIEDEYFLEYNISLFKPKKKIMKEIVDSYELSTTTEEIMDEDTKDKLTRIPPPLTGKPVIYLYPEKPTNVSVELYFDGTISYTYPSYNTGWNVVAQPDGELTNTADNSTHYYLFWEGYANHIWKMDSGFVVKGRDTQEFLIEKLSFLGLTPKEYNDFIVYWVPQMENNPYNFIHFSPVEEYSKIAQLTVNPPPDTLLRIHMAWTPLDDFVDIPKQNLQPSSSRTGFTLVEWGGTKVDSREEYQKLEGKASEIR